MSTQSSTLHNVKTGLGTAIAIQYWDGKRNWWWIGVWSKDRDAAADKIGAVLNWSKEDHREKNSTLFSIVTYDSRQVSALVSRALFAIG